MKIKKDEIVELLKQKVEEWDGNLRRFELKGYPVRLTAQIQYRKKMKTLVSTRELVEKMLLRLKKNESVPVLSKR